MDPEDYDWGDDDRDELEALEVELEGIDQALETCNTNCLMGTRHHKALADKRAKVLKAIFAATDKWWAEEKLELDRIEPILDWIDDQYDD